MRRMNLWRSCGVGVLCTWALMMQAGCQGSQQVAQPGPEPVGGGPVARPSPTEYQVLRRSNRAFNFLVAPGGNIMVFDVTAGRPLVSTQVPPPTLVRVDPKTGIFTGATQVMKGPLPADHVRELRLRK